MAYDLTALIGRADALAPVRHPAVTRSPVRLENGWALVPIDEYILRERLGIQAFDIDDVAASLGPAVVAAGAGLPVAFVHIQTFGGTADEAVAVWREGELVWQARAEDLTDERVSAEALRLVGVVATGGLDEFDTLGLGRHRETEDWFDEP